MRGKNFFLLTAGMAVFAFLAGRALTAGNCAVRAGAPVNADGRPEIALTFDDGPDEVWTPKLLDGLKEREVQATFFLLGQSIEGNEAVVKRMQEEGHLIGNHTYSHVELTKLSPEEAREEVVRTSSAIYDVTGVYTSFVRPPFGEWPDGLEFRVTMIPVNWTVDSRDWYTRNTPVIVRDVLDAAGPGDIILMHDCYETSVEAALQIVDTLKAEGYEFVTVDELILE